MFAIFLGLLIIWDYIMDVLLIFPCICIYDLYLERDKKPNCCITCHCCAGWEGGKHEIDDDELYDNGDGNQLVVNAQKLKEEGNDVTLDGDTTNSHPQDTAPDLRHQNLVRDRYKDVDFDHKPSLIRRILLGYYRLLHKGRWLLLAGSAAAFGVCIYYASKIQLPKSSDVRLLKADHELEKAYSWRHHLLSDIIVKAAGSYATVMWGVSPADTGDHNNPASWSTLVLDDSFDPSTAEAQVYLRDFCGVFFEQDFVSPITSDYECSINLFDQWLQSQSLNETDAQDEIYGQHCDGATGLPMRPSFFHGCWTAWAQQVADYRVLSQEGTVKVMYVEYSAQVRYDRYETAG
jgi:hypothetical protein